MESRSTHQLDELKMTTQEIQALCQEHTLYSWSRQQGLNPIVADRAAGVYVWDTDGKRYLDFSSQLMNANIGHGNPRIAAAVQRQMEKLSFVYPGMATEIRGRLGEKLASVLPMDSPRTLFTLGGSEAIENAVKMARFYTGRHKIITHYRSYHGATTGALSVSGDPRRHPIDGSVMPGVVRVENPYSYRCPWGTHSPEACRDMALRNLEQVIQYEGPGQIAAILMEGESGTSGCIKYPPLYLKYVREICDRYGILFIADEVMSGFGRTGKWFGVEHHGIQPDMICMAKGLTSGYIPMGGVAVSGKIAAHFDTHMLAAGLTYSAHAVACAAAYETLCVMEDEGLVARAAALEKTVVAAAAELQARHRSVGDFRTTGLLGCFELVRNRETRAPLTPFNAAPAQLEATNRIAARLRERGMFTFVRWNYVFVAPPLISTEAQIAEGMDIISDALHLADESCD